MTSTAASASSSSSSVWSLSPLMRREMAKGVKYNMKILLRGMRGCGKTTLLSRLCGHPLPADYRPTTSLSAGTIRICGSGCAPTEGTKVDIWEVPDCDGGDGGGGDVPGDRGTAGRKSLVTTRTGGFGRSIMTHFFSSSEPSSSASHSLLSKEAEEAERAAWREIYAEAYCDCRCALLMVDATRRASLHFVEAEARRVPAGTHVILLLNHRRRHPSSSRYKEEEEEEVSASDVEAVCRRLPRTATAFMTHIFGGVAPVPHELSAPASMIEINAWSGEGLQDLIFALDTANTFVRVEVLELRLRSLYESVSIHHARRRSPSSSKATLMHAGGRPHTSPASSSSSSTMSGDDREGEAMADAYAHHRERAMMSLGGKKTRVTIPPPPPPSSSSASRAQTTRAEPSCLRRRPIDGNEPSAAPHDEQSAIDRFYNDVHDGTAINNNNNIGGGGGRSQWQWKRKEMRRVHGSDSESDSEIMDNTSTSTKTSTDDRNRMIHHQTHRPPLTSCLPQSYHSGQYAEKHTASQEESVRGPHKERRAIRESRVDVEPAPPPSSSAGRECGPEENKVRRRSVERRTSREQRRRKKKEERERERERERGVERASPPSKTTALPAEGDLVTDPPRHSDSMNTSSDMTTPPPPPPPPCAQQLYQAMQDATTDRLDEAFFTEEGEAAEERRRQAPPLEGTATARDDARPTRTDTSLDTFKTAAVTSGARARGAGGTAGMVATDDAEADSRPCPSPRRRPATAHSAGGSGSGFASTDSEAFREGMENAPESSLGRRERAPSRRVGGATQSTVSPLFYQPNRFGITSATSSSSSRAVNNNAAAVLDPSIIAALAAEMEVALSHPLSPTAEGRE